VQQPFISTVTFLLKRAEYESLIGLAITSLGFWLFSFRLLSRSRRTHMLKLLLIHIVHYMGIYAFYTLCLHFFRQGEIVFIFDTSLMPFFILLAIINVALIYSGSELLTGDVTRLTPQIKP